jgi:glycosyltransferase involved in cell wall biosynthesis
MSCKETEKTSNADNVIQLMDYAAPYRGNFIESLEYLNIKLKDIGRYCVYVFPHRAKSLPTAIWIQEIIDNGDIVYYYSGNIASDVLILKSIIKKHDIGVIHLHFENIRLDLAAFCVSRIIPVKLVKHFHNHPDSDSGWKKMIKQIILRKCVLVSVSESVGRLVRQLYPLNRQCVLENAILFERLDNYAVLKRSEFGIEQGSLVCFMMGFDFWRKGVDLVISSIMKIRETMRVTLMISISSNLDKVVSEIRSRLGDVPGWIVLLPPRNDVSTYYRFADIFISASREEGFCYAVVEAAYCEVIIVASKIPGQGDLKIPNVLWFTSGNEKELGEQIIKASELKNSLSEVSELARESVVQKYDINVWCQNVIAAYQYKR